MITSTTYLQSTLMLLCPTFHSFHHNFAIPPASQGRRLPALVGLPHTSPVAGRPLQWRRGIVSHPCCRVAAHSTLSGMEKGERQSLHTGSPAVAATPHEAWWPRPTCCILLAGGPATVRRAVFAASSKIQRPSHLGVLATERRCQFRVLRPPLRQLVSTSRWPRQELPVDNQRWRPEQGLPPH